MTIQPGQKIVIDMEFDWTRNDITKDFSLVVYGDKGELKLTHADGLESAPGLPFIATQ